MSCNVQSPLFDPNLTGNNSNLSVELFLKWLSNIPLSCDEFVFTASNMWALDGNSAQEKSTNIILQYCLPLP